MGFCYSGGRLCCDKCGTPPAVKKRCPAGWCQQTALCQACKAAPGFPSWWSSIHAHCAKASADWAACQAREAALLDAGQYVRTAALDAKGAGVHVLFRNKAGEAAGFYMPSETYGALPLTEPFTPDDYRKHGELKPAPAEFRFS